MCVCVCVCVYFSHINVTLPIHVVISINLFRHVKKHPVSSYFKFKRGQNNS